MFEREQLELKAINEQIEKLTEQKNKITEFVKKSCSHLTKSETYDKLQVVYVPSYYALEIDTEKLIAEQPDLCEKYQKLVFKAETRIVKLVR